MLRNGNAKSCGCFQDEERQKGNPTHGKSHTRLNAIYRGIKTRCYNSNRHDYSKYGGRGIKMCNEWRNDFMAFYTWAINNGYADTLTIDRIDVNGNYEPNNCRWATPQQQSRNRRYCKYFTYDGETHCLSEWCEILGLNYKTVRQRTYRGCNIEQALELEQKT